MKALRWLADPFNLGRCVGIAIGVAVCVPFAVVTLAVFALALAFRMLCDGIGAVARHSRARGRIYDRLPTDQDYADIAADLGDIPFDLLRANDDNTKESTK